MISVLIYDGQKKEAGELEKALRYLTARKSDEQISFCLCRDAGELKTQMTGLDQLHMALVDVTQEPGRKAAAALRARFPQLQTLVIADAGLSPMTYLTPAIRPSALLLRPFDPQHMMSAVTDFFSLVLEPLLNDQESFFWARTREGTEKIPYGSIFYFEARDKRVYVRTRRMEYPAGGTLEKLAEELPPNFIRCHRSYIINRNYIEKIRLAEGFAYLNYEMMVPVSRSYRPQLKEFIGGRG